VDGVYSSFCFVFSSLKDSKHIVTCISIARQRLGKHIPVKRTRATDVRPLLDNDTVNKPPQQERGCFLRGPCRGVIKGQSEDATESSFGMPSCRDMSLELS
jgi:hypothetical protein